MENMIKRNNISVSFLQVDTQDYIEFFKRLKKACIKNKLEDVIVHYDIMDGQFVEQTGVNIETVKYAKKLEFFADAHLMVAEPMKYISKLVKLGVDSITVHYETENLYETLLHLNRLKQQGKIQNVGLAIKPATNISHIDEYLYLVDMILVMSVEPGKGGQKYIENTEDKILHLNRMGKILQVDGGINADTIQKPREAGATSFVVGSYITKDFEKIEENLLKIYNLRG